MLYATNSSLTICQWMWYQVNIVAAAAAASSDGPRYPCRDARYSELPTGFAVTVARHQDEGGAGLQS